MSLENSQDQQVIFNERQDSVAEIILNRPDVHNAFNDAVIEQLINAIDRCQKSTTIRVVVLKSIGKNFSAGADLAWMKSMAGLNFEENKADAANLATLMEKLYRLNKPVIARVQGKSFGGALGLIACSDIAIAESDASFCLSEVKIGLVPAVISPYVVKAIGQRQASRFFMTAEMFNANQALNQGLVHELCDATALDDCIENMIQTLLKNGPAAVAQAKDLVQQVAQAPLNADTINYTTELIASIRVSEEGQEGLGAFLEKRKPNWLNA